jgi:hypothetical protein
LTVYGVCAVTVRMDRAISVRMFCTLCKSSSCESVSRYSTLVICGSEPLDEISVTFQPLVVDGTATARPGSES